MTTETVLIKERIQRDGYTLVLWHEVPAEQAFRDCRLIRDSAILEGWYGVLHTHLVWDFDYAKFRDELRAELNSEPRHYDRDGYCDNPARGY